MGQGHFPPPPHTAAPHTVTVPAHGCGTSGQHCLRHCTMRTHAHTMPVLMPQTGEHLPATMEPQPDVVRAYAHCAGGGELSAATGGTAHRAGGITTGAARALSALRTDTTYPFHPLPRPACHGTGLGLDGNLPCTYPLLPPTWHASSSASISALCHAMNFQRHAIIGSRHTAKRRMADTILASTCSTAPI